MEGKVPEIFTKYISSLEEIRKLQFGCAQLILSKLLM